MTYYVGVIPSMRIEREEERLKGYREFATRLSQQALRHALRTGAVGIQRDL